MQILAKHLAKKRQKIEIAELCKGVHGVDLGKSFQTHIFLQNLASIQPRASPVKTRSGADTDPARRREGTAARDAAALGAFACDSIFCLQIPSKARSRLYRTQILQVNMRVKTLAEIYTMHSFAQI